VKVLASGVSLPDLLATTGTYPPIPDVPVVLGLEAAGEIVAVPEGARFSVGDRVMGMRSIFVNGFGGHAEYAYLLEAETRPVPAHMSDEQAAGFVIGFRTAHAALVDRCAIKNGETLVVLGAAGNSGASAVQLGKALGATVIAVASNKDKLAYCKAIGADHVVNYTTDNVSDEIMAITGGRGADVIFDPVGGELSGQAVKVIAQYGRIAIVGFASGSPITLDAFDMLLREYSAIGLLAAGDGGTEFRKGARLRLISSSSS
jgi:NADPH2:quinone reductase